jgi:hypothetical protein
VAALSTPVTLQTTASGLTIATTAYTSGDMLGQEQTLTGAAASTGGRGVITEITLQNSANTVALGATELWIFPAASTPAADNAAAAWADAILRGNPAPLAAIAIPAPTTIGATGQMITVGGLWLPFTTGATANMFVNHVTRTGHTFFTAATDIQLTFEIVQWV